MVLFPNAKINLGLFVTKKRVDGFHELETCFFPIPWSDILEITPALAFKFSSSGLPISGEIHDNLCYKAFLALSENLKIPNVHIHLHKIIPMGAGMGGGSSNAAFTLMGVRDLFELPLTNQELFPYAQKLGSDCAFFLNNEAQFGIGKGDELTPIPTSLRGLYAIILYPNFGISTQKAYAGIEPNLASGFLPDLLKSPMPTWKHTIKNDFEKALFVEYPLLAEIKQDMYDLGAVYAAMSGSGSTIFGLFNKEVSPKDSWSNFLKWEGLIP
jgi:4-diphosphocytidyl-2-C-methyl-D-erythritol kinase